MFAPVTKRSFVPQTFVELAFAAFGAPEAALAAPARPVYLEIPTDLLAATGEEPAMSAGDPRSRAPDVEPALDLVAAARRPLVWAGGGAVAAGASDAVGALAQRLGAPVVTTYSAAGIAAGHPLHVGLPPHVPEIGALWDEADLVIAVGSDLDGMMTQNWRMPAPQRLVAINVDEADAAKNWAPDVIVGGDARDACEALARELSGAREPWVDVAALRARTRERLHGDFPAEMRFLDAFAGALPPEAVVLCDMCIPGYWLGGFHPAPAPRRLTYPLGWGTLGCAFPQSLGAALAGSGPVVSVSGDGGFLFACGELATVAQERLPVTTVIVDDGGYGMLRFDQRRAGTPPVRRRSAHARLRRARRQLRRARRGRGRPRGRFRRRAAPPRRPTRSRRSWSLARRSSRRRRRRRAGIGRQSEGPIVEHGASPLAVRRTDGPKNPAVAPKTVRFGQFGLPRNFP